MGTIWILPSHNYHASVQITLLLIIYGLLAKNLPTIHHPTTDASYSPFITMTKRANVDEYVIKILAGHKITDITEGTYTKRDIEWLREELLKMP